ncbi:uncharacterized protein LOC115891941 [Sitophilus oryzae]|uniref:Uncharacterized protein LOC115891941 n=1 Tax=Sitophilus oryzae TaxID=7048 RepID=A0A6J2YZ10_SITOR|nr:uncharacterized protein LOC115891941 [Sitophilus oryzae]
MRVLQINANRSIPVHDTAAAVAASKKCDVICITEPNKKICRNGNRNYYHNSNANAMIINFNKNLHALEYKSGHCYVSVRYLGICIISAYLSPNITFDSFCALMLELQEATLELKQKHPRTKLLITGDFNTKHEVWGGNRTERRGREVLEWYEINNLTVLNDGIYPTLVRTSGTSYIDLSIVCDGLLQMKPIWQVLEDPDVTEHKFIFTEIPSDNSQGKKIRYKYGEINKVKLSEAFKYSIPGKSPTMSAYKMAKIIRATYHKSTPTVRCDEDFQMPYWWNEDIQTNILEVKKKRRRFQRETRNDDLRELYKRTYKEAKQDLSQKIRIAKISSWEKLCDDLQENIYGQAYKIIRSQLKKMPPRVQMDPEEKIKQFKALFVYERQTWTQQIIYKL